MKSIREAISTIVNDCISEIKRNSTNAGQVATGRTLKSLQGEVFSYGDAYTAQIIGAAYLGVLETGRGRAKNEGTPYQQKEFLRNLVEWCRIRQIPREAISEEQYEQFAKYLKWRINRYGTQLYQRGGRKDIITPPIEKMIKRIEDEVLLLIDGEIKSTTSRFF